MKSFKRILVLGSGGREHVFVWKLAQELNKENLFAAPGNAGMQDLATVVKLDTGDFEAIAEFCKSKQIDAILPGSEEPLVRGIYDYFKNHAEVNHIYVFGPSAAAAQLEGSKTVCKQFMQKHSIPTARYKSFDTTELSQAIAFLDTLQSPYVLKADGLAAGKGVLIINDRNEAAAELQNMLLNQKFGSAGNRVVIEEFMDGIEFSVFVATDGEHFVLLPEAKDYKRIGDGDTGLNTGGMGAVSPVVFADEALMEKVVERIIKPTINGIKSDGLTYHGFIFFGLMNIEGEPKVVEYNVRMGDPETEVVIPRLQSSLLTLMEMSATGQLNEYKTNVNPQFCTTVFTVSGGYPEAYEKNKAVSIGEVPEHCLLFHAGTGLDGKGQLQTTGGRVLAVSGFGDTLQQALEISYAGVKNISFDKMYYRSDIGMDLINIPQ